MAEYDKEFFNDEEIETLRGRVKGGEEKAAKILFEMDKEYRKRDYRERLLNGEA